MPHLWLIGMMGSGKSAVGRRVAGELGMRLIDLDDEIATRLGCSVSQLWGERGEEAFRDLEQAAVTRVAAGDDAVVATGGGVVLRDANIAAMRESGIVVWLRADPAVLSARVESGVGRPLLAEGEPRDVLDAILAAREDRYARAAHVVIDSGTGTADEVADEVTAQWTAS